MNFPEKVSFTITNACNLRCKMCGQWSEDGYISNDTSKLKSQMGIEKWKSLVDEISEHGGKWLLIRGGEPFLFPGIIELLQYINTKNIFMAIDTNGTFLEKYAEDLVSMGNMHITISVDGTEEIHDEVRGVKGTFGKLKRGMAKLNKLDDPENPGISRSICFTAGSTNYKTLGEIPDIARDLKIKSINMMPYYYLPEKTGLKYEKEIKELGCTAFSWHGFHHDDPGVDPDEFLEVLNVYRSRLNGIDGFPYMPLTDEEYRSWFSEAESQVGVNHCLNIEKLIDIQPNGDLNFCVDFIDYIFGNVNKNSIKELWNSEAAERFRKYRRKKSLSVCYRCGAKYISEL